MKKRKMKKNNAVAFAAALCMISQMIPAGLNAAEENISADFMYGDLNDDNTADMSDLSILSLYLLKDITLDESKVKAADTNGDGEINLGDMAHMKRYVSKYPVTLGPQIKSTSLKLKAASGWEEVYDFMIKNAQPDYYYDQIQVPSANGTTAAVTTAAAASPDQETSVIGSENKDYSETYNQEKNVLESDIVKTDGEAIYSFTSSYNSGERMQKMKVVYANDGKFEKSYDINIDLSECQFKNVSNVRANNMYLYNDMIIVLGTAYAEDGRISPDSQYSMYYGTSSLYTFVSAYKKGTDEQAPELINTYYQEGCFKDVRITPDGYMYLITNGGYANYWYHDMVMPSVTGTYTTIAVSNDTEVSKSQEITETKSDETSFDEETVKSLVPVSGTNEGVTPVSPENIFIPADTSDTYTNSYTVIGSIDFNSSDSIKNTDTKIISGYTGKIYCSENNLYLTHNRYNYRYSIDENENETDQNEKSLNVTEITRISLNSGSVLPEASGEVPGYIKDQFSMSEYNGYFRIVTTADYSVYNKVGNKPGYYTSERSNNVFVLDMNLCSTGEITHFAKEESVKSVSFAGNIGYIVTYVQTDPLFAVDFSDPKNPVILDEYKIDGFSTYMQKWDEEHLLGFGVSTYVNDYGSTVRDGYKLVMFDNSDPENLKEDGIYKMNESNKEMIEAFISEDENNTNIPEVLYTYLSSTAEYERKELLIAPEKNLIGIPLEYGIYSEEWINNIYKYGYVFFSYDDSKFTMKNFLTDSGEISGNDYYNYYNRAVYIGDYVYIISGETMVAADIETCTRTDEINIR